MQETQVWFLGGKDPLEEEMATHSIPKTEKSLEYFFLINWLILIGG